MDQAADIGRWLFLASMLFAAVRLAPGAYRALTKHRGPLDPIWCLWFNFILSRLFFTWRAAHFANPFDRPLEGTTLLIGYIWGISLYVATFVVYGWYNRRG